MKKHLTCCRNIFGVLIDFRRRILPEDHFVETDDRIDRRPDLMTHVGKKRVLCQIQFADLVLLSLLFKKTLFDGVLIIIDDYAEKNLNGDEICEIPEIALIISCVQSVHKI